jgi:hypothetical protein
VGIEPATTLRRQKLLILLNGKNAKNTAIAQVRYTAGTHASVLPLNYAPSVHLGSRVFSSKSVNRA